MSNLLCVLLYITSGFFLTAVFFLSFVNDPGFGAGKWWFALGFAILSLMPLCVGLALKRFLNWRRTIGTVLLSSSALTLFEVFTFACIQASGEFGLAMKPETLSLFSDYFSGISVTLCIGFLGFLMLRVPARRVQ